MGVGSRCLFVALKVLQDTPSRKLHPLILLRPHSRQNLLRYPGPGWVLPGWGGSRALHPTQEASALPFLFLSSSCSPLVLRTD